MDSLRRRLTLGSAVSFEHAPVKRVDEAPLIENPASISENEYEIFASSLVWNSLVLRLPGRLCARRARWISSPGIGGGRGDEGVRVALALPCSAGPADASAGLPGVPRLGQGAHRRRAGLDRVPTLLSGAIGACFKGSCGRAFRFGVRRRRTASRSANASVDALAWNGLHPGRMPSDSLAADRGASIAPRKDQIPPRPHQGV